jgi:hypothetical protein
MAHIICSDICGAVGGLFLGLGQVALICIGYWAIHLILREAATFWAAEGGIATDVLPDDAARSNDDPDEPST